MYSQSIKYTSLQKPNNCVNVELIWCVVLKRAPSTMRSKPKRDLEQTTFPATTGSAPGDS